MSKEQSMTTQSKNKSVNILNVAESVVKLSKGGASIIVPHMCNNKNIFFGGLSKDIEIRYPKVKADFEVGLNNSLGKVQFSKAYGGYGDQAIYIANMIAVDIDNNRSKIKYPALIHCMGLVSEFINKLKNHYSDHNIHIYTSPKDFPCSKNEFFFIHNIMQDVWKNIPIYTY